MLSAPKARVVRDGNVHEVGVSQVVADDVLFLEPGDQIVVDGEVLEGVGLEVDESLLTGESEPIDKMPGAEVLSGSFVSAGSGHYRATRVGAESFAAALSEEARQFRMSNSELRTGINQILRWMMIVIPPVCLLLALRLFNKLDRWQDAMRDTVAAAIAMVPEGLVLLTSLAFMTGVIALARRRALAKELVSVELLARVDTLCLDKTGTITTGEISLGGIELLDGADEQAVRAALGAMAAADPSPNATLAAIAAGFETPAGWTADRVTPFSSARKWAGARFDGRGSYYLGAPDIVFDADDETARDRVGEHAEEGRRVLLLTHSDGPYTGDSLPDQRTPLALVLLEDTVKPDAPEILAFFADQGVDLKVISGDHPQTVAAVARRAGVPNATTGFDARQLPEGAEDLADLVEAQAVFGRVTPHQKRAMIAALQSRGRVVAMTGDGVNDVLALKDSDMGIAMGSGSSSTRAVAQLVLLDNRFATLPLVLDEGRRIINNVERVANLFITKTIYAVLLTALVAVVGHDYPFLPRQLSLIGTFSIGIPGFFLALAPNTQLVRPGFLPPRAAVLHPGRHRRRHLQLRRLRGRAQHVGSPRTARRSPHGGHHHAAVHRARHLVDGQPAPSALEGRAGDVHGTLLPRRDGDRAAPRLLRARPPRRRGLGVDRRGLGGRSGRGGAAPPARALGIPRRLSAPASDPGTLSPPGLGGRSALRGGPPGPTCSRRSSRGPKHWASPPLGRRFRLPSVIHQGGTHHESQAPHAHRHCRPALRRRCGPVEAQLLRRPHLIGTARGIRRTAAVAPRRATSHGFALAICVAATIVVATEIVGEGWSLLREERPAFAVIGAALLASEIWSASWLRNNGRSATLSWVFAFALVLLGGHLESLLLMAAVGVVSELTHKQRNPLLIATNCAQLVVALGASLSVLRLADTEFRLVDGSELDARWVASVAGAGATLYLTNVAVVAIYAGLRGHGRIRDLLPRFARLNLSGDGMLIALAPVLVIVCERSLLVLPFVGITMAALNWTSKASASHQREAEEDALTGLPNRRRLQQELEHLTTPSTDGSVVGAVILLDLDGFKPVNDRYGHAAGDAVLCEVATRLSARLPGDGLVARLGGDEFAVVLPTVRSAGDALLVGLDLRAALRSPMLIGDAVVEIDGSFGIALLADHPGGVPELMAAADRAMYKAKYGGLGITSSGPDHPGTVLRSVPELDHRQRSA